MVNHSSFDVAEIAIDSFKKGVAEGQASSGMTAPREDARVGPNAVRVTKSHLSAVLVTLGGNTRKISCIKAYREITGESLIVSKEAIEDAIARGY